MKKILLLCLNLLFILSEFSVNAQSVIEMEESGGVYKIPCLVNGARMKLIFDTGAATVCLSQSMAEYLLENDYISKEDFVGEGRSIVADGRVVNHLEVILKDIEISGYHINDVLAVVVEGQQAPLLLGQTAIQKLGKIEINGNKITIQSVGDTLSDEEIDNLFEKIDNYRSNRMYASAAECYEKLHKVGVLSDYGVYQYGLVLWFADNNKKALDIMLSVEDKQAIADKGSNIYHDIANIYCSNDRYSESISYFEKALVDYKSTAKERVYIYRDFGMGYAGMRLYHKAADMYFQAWKAKAAELGVPEQYFQNDCTYYLERNQKSVKDDDSDYIYFEMWRYMYLSNQCTWEQFEFTTLRIGAYGNKYAQRYWDAEGINCKSAYRLKYE